MNNSIKMPIYAKYGVAFAWLIDPRARTLEAYARKGKTWCEIGRFVGTEQVAIAPFEAVTIDLADLWMPQAAS